MKHVSVSNLSRMNNNAAYHISSTEEYSVEQVVRKVCSILGLDYRQVVDTSTDRSGADVRYSLDSSKTHGLGWSPRFRFDDTLVDIVGYYREKLGKS